MIHMNWNDSFFGRKDTLDLLKKRINDLKEGYRQNIAFLGSAYIGKSMILQKVLSDLDDDQIVPVHLDLEKRDLHYIFTRFAGSILYNFAKIAGLPEQDELGILMEQSRSHIPKTVEGIRKIQENLTKGRRTEAYRQIISLPETFTLESGKFCVIVLEEFHNLDDLGVVNSFAELGKKIMMQKRCLYFVTSSCRSSAQQILSEKLSLLFGNFEILHIGPFDLQTSQGFIAHNLRTLRISDELKAFLTDFTGGHPLYLKLICQELCALSAIYQQEEIFQPLLVQSLENTIFQQWGVLSRHFELTIDRLCQGKGFCMPSLVLITLANGKHKIKTMADAMGLKKAQLTPRLNKLIEQDIVVKNGGYYHFRDKLFKCWVKYVFQKRLKPVSLNTDRLKEQFRAEMTSLLMDFTKMHRKDLSDRIVELLHCFDNEAYRLNGRKYKLPAFQQIVPLQISQEAGRSFTALKASTENEVWYLVLRQEGFNEEDLSAFLQQIKNLEGRPQKKVIIALAGLDQNARLKALQEKMWIWNESELNELLDLYGKPYIVR